MTPRQLRKRARLNAHRDRLDEIAKAVRAELPRAGKAGFSAEPTMYGDTTGMAEHAWQDSPGEIRIGFRP